MCQKELCTAMVHFTVVVVVVFVVVKWVGTREKTGSSGCCFLNLH